MGSVDDFNSSVSPLEIFPDAVGILNQDSTFVFVNQVLIRLFGYTREEFLSHKVSFQELFSPIYLGISDIANRQFTRYTEYEMKTKTGSLFSVALTITPFYGDLRMVVLRDLSEIYRARREALHEFINYAEANTAFIKYSFTELGPKPDIGINLDFLQTESPGLFEKLGVHYMMAVSQGELNKQGLFGPLPVSEMKELLAIVFSYIIKTENHEIYPRLKGKIPSLIVIVFNKNLESLFLDRRRIRRILEEHVVKSEYQDPIDLPSMQKMLESIRDRIFSEYDEVSDRLRPVERKLAAIYELIRNYRHFQSIEEMFQLLAELAEQVLDFKKFSVRVIDRSTNSLRHLCQKGFHNSLAKLELPIDEPRSIVAKAVRLGETIYVPDVSMEDDYLEFDPAVRSELVIPIKARQHVVGVLNIESEQLDGFSDDDKLVMETLADQASIFLEREEIETRFQAIHNLMRQLTQSSTKEEAFEKMGDFAQRTLQFKTFSILLLDEQTDELYVACHQGYPQESEVATFRISRNSPNSLVARCLQEGRLINIEDVRKISFYLPVYPQTKSELVVPIIYDNKTIGVINAESPSKSAFSTTDERILEILAGVVDWVLKFSK
ncbi:MAG: GAF domain-containing protein [Promethearchaeota archaeon]